MHTHYQVQDAQSEEVKVQYLCNSTRLEACALVVGSASLTKAYEKYQIRWKFCKRCGAKDKSQDAFESELVLGVDHCLMCSAIEQQRERIDDYHSGKSAGTCTAEERLADHTTTLSVATVTKDCHKSHEMMSNSS